MARLNEPPLAPQPAPESTEVLKRRFLRQNRELAKTNSQQSIRLRCLENDCSRLLAENLSLREHVLQLQNAAESRPSFDHIDSVATQLEAKIQELGGLVAGLARLKKGSEKRDRKSQAAARRRSGEQRQWRSGLGLQDVENAMLPTIMEDKFFPRRTMGADELRQVLDEPDSQSPDIGPPPISRYENEEPISFDPNPASADPTDDICQDEEPALPMNLETRKKRRESGPKMNIRRVSVFESPEELEEDAAKSTRTGAKRKFSVQGDEEKDEQKGDAFRFSRRNNSNAQEVQEHGQNPRPASPARPVLGAKPVNTDPVVSPKKQRSLQENQDKKPLPMSKSRARPRINITRNVIEAQLLPLPMPEPVQTAEIILESLPPKTPAVEEIFSPPSTEPSTQRPESKDTPPPGDLTSSDQTGQAGRPGRRARPQVSYKEPSLHTKMRRPDAKLVDAVVDRRTSVEPQPAPSTTIKRDSTGDLNWKPVSAATGGAGEEEGEVGSPLRQKLDRRDVSHDSKTTQPIQPEERSTASKAISALINETSAAKRKMAAASGPVVPEPTSSSNTQNKTNTSREPTAKPEGPDKDSLAVFDFTDSSPAKPPRAGINDLAKAARSARRHSSIPASSSFPSSSLEDRKTAKAEGALPSLHKRTGSGTVKSSSSNIHSSKSNSGVPSMTKTTSAPRLSTTKDKKPPETLPLDDSCIDVRLPAASAVAEKESAARAMATSKLRAERAASRRKSMML